MMGARHYATRSAAISPNILVPSKHLSFLNWKLTTASFLAGATLAFSETLFEQYVKLTKLEGTSLLPVKIQYKVKSHPLYEKLANCNTENWLKIDSPFHSWGVESASKQSLVSQFIAKPGGIMTNPVLFFEPNLKKTISLVHLGYRMCGYPFLIHGGIIATLLNESCKTSVYLFGTGLSDSTGHIKVQSLNVSYRYPTFANQVLAIETSMSESSHTIPSGKSIKSKVLSEEGKVLVESEALLSVV